MLTTAAMAPVASLAILIGVPLLVIGVIVAIVVGPRWGSAGRWRPGQPWPNAPLQIGAGDPGPSALPPGQSTGVVGGNIAPLVEAESPASEVVGMAANNPRGDRAGHTGSLGGAHGTW